jgi:hypothetical protein
VPVPQIYQCLGTVSRYGGKLKEQNQLNSEPTYIETHFCRGQDDPGKFSQVLDIHSGTLSFSVIKFLDLSHGFDQL